MTDVNKIFEDLAANNSRLFKIDYLKQHKDNGILRNVVSLALDPFTQFYIRKIPKYETIPGSEVDLNEAIQRLYMLSSRTYTGNKAIEFLRDLLSNVSASDAKVIERIIAKDLKCGVSVATANEIWPGLVDEYPCMLCSGYEEKLVDKIPFPAYVQLKLDGMRFNAIVRSGEVEFRSRNGKEIELLGFLEDEFRTMAGDLDMVFDGELTVQENGVTLNRQTGNGILNKASKGTISKEEASKVHATVWDAIPYLYFKDGYYNRKYEQRFRHVRACVNSLGSDKVSYAPYDEVHNTDQVNELFQKYYASGEEGIILKSMEAPWENKRSKHQIKYKGELECDLVVTGVEEGRGKYQGKIGALIAESSDGLVKVSVGSGLTDDLRTSLSQEDVIGRIITVKYNARIKNKQGDHSLFLPIFIELRSDKDSANHSKEIK
jgi:ATP-dependent DNA ligase